MVFFFTVLGVIWYFGHGYIVNVFLKLKIFEANFLGLFFEQFKEESISLSQVNAYEVVFESLPTLSLLGDNVFRYITSVILLVLAGLVYKKSLARRFKRKHNMKDLLKLEKDVWPHITPVINLDLVKEDPSSGKWAVALSPIKFCEKNNLLNINKEEFEQKKRGVNISLKKDLANMIFVKQLGYKWEGVEKLPNYVKALFAVFASRINMDKGRADKILQNLSISSVKNSFNMEGVDEAIRKYINSAIVKKTITQRAYISTVMASMLEEARKDGVMSAAQFLWLKPLDRTLWYVLNSVGRQTPFVGCSGVFSHWLAEKEIGQALHVPTLEQAVNGLEKALQEVIYIPN